MPCGTPQFNERVVQRFAFKVCLNAFLSIEGTKGKLS